MAWVEHWQALALRIDALLKAGELFAVMLEAGGRVDHFNFLGKAFLPELSEVISELKRFRDAHRSALPPAAQDSFRRYLELDTAGGLNVGQLQALMPLALLRSQVEYAMRDTELR